MERGDATVTKGTYLSIFGRGGRETEVMLTWVGIGKRVFRVGKTLILIIWVQERSIQKFIKSE